MIVFLTGDSLLPPCCQDWSGTLWCLRGLHCPLALTEHPSCDNNSVLDLKAACCHRTVTVSQEHCCGRTSYGPDALPVAQPTASKHWGSLNCNPRLIEIRYLLECNHHISQLITSFWKLIAKCAKSLTSVSNMLLCVDGLAVWYSNNALSSVSDVELPDGRQFGSSSCRWTCFILVVLVLFACYSVWLHCRRLHWNWCGRNQPYPRTIRCMTTYTKVELTFSLLFSSCWCFCR